MQLIAKELRITKAFLTLAFEATVTAEPTETGYRYLPVYRNHLIF